jgi:hypothetical protein
MINTGEETSFKEGTTKKGIHNCSELRKGFWGWVGSRLFRSWQ